MRIWIGLCCIGFFSSNRNSTSDISLRLIIARVFHSWQAMIICQFCDFCSLLHPDILIIKCSMDPLMTMIVLWLLFAFAALNPDAPNRPWSIVGNSRIKLIWKKRRQHRSKFILRKIFVLDALASLCEWVTFTFFRSSVYTVSDTPTQPWSSVGQSVGANWFLGKFDEMFCQF